MKVLKKLSKKIVLSFDLIFIVIFIIQQISKQMDFIKFFWNNLVLILIVVFTFYLIFLYLREKYNELKIYINTVEDKFFVLMQIIRANNYNVFSRIQGVSGQNYFNDIKEEKEFVIQFLSISKFKNKTRTELETIVNELYSDEHHPNNKPVS